MKLMRPIKTNLKTQGFGENKLPIYNEMGMKGHNGWDWKAYDGEPIYWDCTDCEGEVLELHTDTKGGLGVDIITSNSDGIFKHRFWHLKSFKCTPGQILSTGDIIGLADNTGMSTGTHLHRGLKRQGKLSNGKYYNIDQMNGYFGGIDIEPYFVNNIYIKDYVMNLTAQVTILQRIMQIIKDFMKGRGR